ncbi:MAG: flavin reductase family protein, partial [Clostridiales bacterium]|nr:flavin reductase family protein [Clostridiales bacterium]
PPTMVTCRSGAVANVLTIAWTGILNTIPPKTYISVRPERYSYNLIKESGVFVINLTTEDLVRACDFCGVKSGENTDKFKEMNLEVTQGSKVDVPLLADSPINIECKVTEIVNLGSHHMFIANIVAINVAKELLDKNGRLQMEKAGLVAYAHGEYFALGDKLGSFGYSVKKKTKKRKGKAFSEKRVSFSDERLAKSRAKGKGKASSKSSKS